MAAAGLAHLRLAHDALTEELFGNATFAQLRLPIAVVAADLAMGKRAVLDSGPVAPAPGRRPPFPACSPRSG